MRHSEPSQPPPAAMGGPVLAFDVAGQRYGLPVESIGRIVEMVAMSRLPAAPDFIVGVIDFQGEIIPVVDLRRQFNQPARPYTLRTPIIVGQLNGHTVGLIVDGVRGTVELGPEQIELAGQIVTEEMVPQTFYLSGVARLNDGLLLLLDPDILFSRREEARLESIVDVKMAGEAGLAIHHPG